MKKLLAVSLCLAMLLMTAACGNPGNSAPSSSGEDSTYENALNPGQIDEGSAGENEDEDLPPENADSGGEDEAPNQGAENPSTAKPNNHGTSSNNSGTSNTKPSTPQKPAETNPDPKPTESSKGYSGTLPELINAIYAKQPVDFALGEPTAVDLTDSYSGQYFLGLSDTSKVKEAYYSEAMIGSQAYSLAVVRVKDAADAAAVAQNMYDGIDQAKWICVTADALAVGAYGDTIMLVMVDSSYGETLHTDLRAAFASVCGGKLGTSLDRLSADAVPKDGLATGA